MHSHRSSVLLLLATAGTLSAADLTVGTGKTYSVPSQAAAVAVDGDNILIDDDTYDGDVCTWTANNLTIRGVGGRPHLRAAGMDAQGKGTWVISGNNVTVEDIELSGSAVTDQNGAGIRFEGSGLTVRRCYFHENQNGILANAGASSDILIENSEFYANGAGDGFSHNLYIGQVRTLTFRGNYSHDAVVGHDLKSRAKTNIIVANRIMDEAGGSGSYTIDLPNGGLSFLIGNLIQQGPLTQNPAIISYGEEGASNPDQRLYVINNTMVNDLGHGTFLVVAGTTTEALLTNNLFIGGGTVVSGSATQSHNLTGDGSLLVDRTGFDYHLANASAAIDAGIDPGTGGGQSLAPVLAYLHPTSTAARTVIGSAIDVGAYESASTGGGGTGGGGGGGTGTPAGPGGSGPDAVPGSGPVPDDAGSCGKGGGTALVLLGLLAAFRAFRRR